MTTVGDDDDDIRDDRNDYAGDELTSKLLT